MSEVTATLVPGEGAVVKLAPYATTADAVKERSGVNE